jgi:hypothetical protein
MKKWLGLLFLLVPGGVTQAHPGVGIVADRHGNVFFTDLKQVWKITADGKQTVAVPGVHSHELCVDAAYNLYGEHYWHDAQTKRWMRRVWCLQSNGSLTEVLPPQEGFLRNYSFVRDRMGSMYWIERRAKPVLMRRSPDGKSAPHTATGFRQVEWMTVAPDGALFLMDGGDLRRVAPDGKVTTVVTKLTAHKPPPAEVSDRNYHMGIWCDAGGAVYVAVAREGLVLQVQADGQTKVVARSGASWSPSGGTFDRKGNMWLLEFDAANAVRVRRIDRAGRERIFGTDPPRR